MSYNNLVHNSWLIHWYSWLDLKFEIVIVRNSTRAFVNTLSSAVNSDSPSQLPNYDDFYRNRWRAPTSFTDVLFKVKIGIDLISLVALSIHGTWTERPCLALLSLPIPVSRSRNKDIDGIVNKKNEPITLVPVPVLRTDHLDNGISTDNRSSSYWCQYWEQITSGVLRIDLLVTGTCTKITSPRYRQQC